MTRVIVLFMLVLASVAATAIAQPASAQAPARDRSRPFEITDNSFLVEEAFNQERGVFQNIFTMARSAGPEWQFLFTQEWPLGGMRHQFSYSLPFAAITSPPGRVERGVGDLLLNYRFQALEEGPGRPAMSPRLSVIVPTGSSERGLGAGTGGLQVDVPMSKQQRDLYWHGNAGFTFLPRVETSLADGHVRLFSPSLAGSVIWRARNMVNVLCEAVFESRHELADSGATTRTAVVTVAPGVRGGWNIGDRQLVIGLAFPTAVNRDSDRLTVFGYFSYELPFKK